LHLLEFTLQTPERQRIGTQLGTQQLYGNRIGRRSLN
jgi:hypothetical protein